MTYMAGATNFQNANLDAFGRLRTSNIITQFESKFTYGNEEKLFNTTLVTGGTSTFLPNEAAWNLTTTTSSGSRVLRQSYNYMQYHPGKSQHILMTGVFGAAVANCVKRIGYYDDNDGLFFIQNGTAGFGICERTSTSGSPVDTISYQTSWNVDKLDGTGPSGITLDVTKTQIFVIDFQWLGVGTVRYGVAINNQLIYFHISNHSNNTYTQVYMKSAWLPIRYEILNAAATATTATLKQICSMVASEGGLEEKGTFYSASDPATSSVTAGNWIPLVSITVGTTLNGQPFRGKIQMDSIATMTSGNIPAIIGLFEGGSLTGPSWTSPSSTSAVTYDTAATAFTGGILRYSGFNGKTTDFQTTFNNAFVGYAGDIYTLAAKGVGGTATLNGAINWREII